MSCKKYVIIFLKKSYICYASNGELYIHEHLIKKYKKLHSSFSLSNNASSLLKYGFKPIYVNVPWLLVWQVTELVGIKATLQMNAVEESERAHAEEEDDGEEGGGCELSLSLSLPNPSSKRSNSNNYNNNNNGCSTSEISEAISSSIPAFSNYKHCFSSSSAKHTINLELSLALCGN